MSGVSSKLEPSIVLSDPRATLARFPIDATALSELAKYHAINSNHTTAERLFSRLIRLKPQSSSAQLNHAASLANLGNFSDSNDGYCRLIALQPDSRSGWDGRAVTANQLTDHAQATTSFSRAATISPSDPLPLSNLGGALCKLGKFESSIQATTRAVCLNPGHSKSYVNLANAKKAIGSLDDADRYYDRAIFIAPGEPASLWNKSMLLLMRGNLREGFKLYEHRLELRDYRIPLLPRWNGSTPIDGKVILARAEQGLGDTIQFSRFVHGLLDLKAIVHLSAPASLHKLLATSFPSVSLARPDDPAPQAGFEISLMSLPAILGIDEARLPYRERYICAETDRKVRWARSITNSRFNVGIAWQGKSTAPVDHGRSIPWRRFEIIANLENVRVFSLQKTLATELSSHEISSIGIESFGDALDRDGAFLDTAAIMTCLDLVITSDTSIAHLAGALGVPVWVVLQQVPEWRWMLGRTDSPWYPSMRLFRQRVQGRWEDPFYEMAKELRSLASSKY